MRGIKLPKRWRCERPYVVLQNVRDFLVSLCLNNCTERIVGMPTCICGTHINIFVAFGAACDRHNHNPGPLAHRRLSPEAS
jgi:hypothetical protein